MQAQGANRITKYIKIGLGLVAPYGNQHELKIEPKDKIWMKAAYRQAMQAYLNEDEPEDADEGEQKRRDLLSAQATNPLKVAVLQYW